MDTMTLPGGGTMSMAWMPMCGQSWISAATSFLVTWTVMMAAMMLPSLVPMLWRYRHASRRIGEPRPALLTALVGGGYLLVWTVLGMAVFPLGVATAAATMRHPELARAVPAAIALVFLGAGALQFSRWKAHQLACCRGSGCHQPFGRGRRLPARAFTAWRHGLRLGLHCAQCCAGLTAILLLTGMMDVPAMLAVTGAITLERLAPGGERIARAIGVIVVGAGLLQAVRAVGLA
jgi:predicted metal-binding membrane protein